MASALRHTLARSLWPSPQSSVWTWHRVQHEMRTKNQVCVLTSVLSDSALRCVEAYLAGGGSAARAMRALRAVGGPLARHNCAELVRWTRDPEWVAALPHLGELDPRELQGLALRCGERCCGAGAGPRLVWWWRGRFMGYHRADPAE